ncbi:hypothetical protein [uncultured Zobellia sp.]|uniref:hypothetical protein n=1 Tax=uncultured Zobellia sp. TaxID=255433 RepID=UPI0025979E89|nr:hypothetical protein [uncultured Zobellia sp.]
MKSIFKSPILLLFFIIASCSKDNEQKDAISRKGLFRVEVTFSDNHSFEDYIVGASVSADHYIPIMVNKEQPKNNQVANVDFNQKEIVLEPIEESTFISLLVSARPNNTQTASNYTIEFYFDDEKIYSDTITLNPNEEVWYDSFLLGTERNLKMEYKSSNNPITWDDI